MVYHAHIFAHTKVLSVGSNSSIPTNPLNVYISVFMVIIPLINFMIMIIAATVRDSMIRD